MMRDYIEQRVQPDPNSGCWIWTLACDNDGYGRVKVVGYPKSAHRAAWVAFNGAIPDGLHVLHSCDTPACCNPAHLRLGTAADNVADTAQRGRNKGTSLRMEHCRRGHPFDEGNTFIDSRGDRGCVECRRIGQRERRRLKKVPVRSLSVQATDKSDRAEGVAALQQAGEPISRENLEAELRETIGLYVREAVTRMFSEENATYRCARQIAGMLQPGYYLHRKLFSSPLPQQTALVEQGVEKIIAPHEPAACGASAPSEPPQLPGEDAIAEIIARYVGQHPFEEMAEDRRDLRDKVRTQDGYDVNEPTRSDCRDAAAVILGKVFPR